jgi:hypothetical protein
MSAKDTPIVTIRPVIKTAVGCILLIISVYMIELYTTEAEAKMANVNSITLDDFDSIELDAGVYLCTVLNRIPSTKSDGNIERGSVTLSIVTVYRGKNRPTVVLPYSFVRPGGIMTDGWCVWPRLDNVGGNQLLCVIVPNSDPTAGSLPGISEAASRVIVVSGATDPRAQELADNCKLYDMKNDAEILVALKSAVMDSRPAVRDFALKTAVIRLGKTDPKDALGILRSKAAQYVEGAENPEAQGIITFIRGKFGRVEPWDQMNKFLCRCLVVLAQSPSVSVREQSLAALVHGITLFNYRPGFRLQDGLDRSEKEALSKILDLETNTPTTIPTTSRTGASAMDKISNVRVLRGWLSS